MSAKLRWGILATGRIARMFAIDLAGSATGRLTAVGSRSAEAAAGFARDFGGIRAHGSYEALLADPGVDAIYLATPHPFHEEWAVLAAKAGKHVLCEKPLALDSAGAARMVAAARQAGVLLMEGYMYRCHPLTLRLAEAVRAGVIGEVQAIRASFNIIRPYAPEHRIFNRALGGGAILDLGCYPVSFSRLIAGAAAGQPFAEPVEFHATGRLHPEARTDLHAAAVARFANGILAELSCGSTVMTDISASIHGTTGWIELPTPFAPGLGGRTDRILVHHTGRTDPEVWECMPEQGLYAYEADAVATALAGGKLEVPQMTHADTLGNMAVLEAWCAAVGVNYEGV